MRTPAVVAVTMLLLAAGCASSPAAQPDGHVIKGAEWRAVVDDWVADGHLDHRHSCGAVIVALARLRSLSYPASYVRAALDLDRYAGTVCPRHGRIDKIVVGMTDGAVANLAGMPRTPRLNCWLYAVTRTHTGRRVCFTNGRVSLVQISVHG